MRNSRLFRSTLLAASLIALSSCASSGTTGGDDAAAVVSGDAVAVRVSNDLVPPATITVWMVPETGGRRRLGTVTPNGQETFSFSPGVRSMEHRLLAEVTGGAEHQSNPFDLVAATAVRWSVSAPNVSIERGDD